MGNYPTAWQNKFRRPFVLKKIFVGNLPFSTHEEQLEELFEQYGNVQSARIITDRETGRSRGFGFVEMDDEGADTAVANHDGIEFEGRALRVNEAHEKPSRQQAAAW